jgi:ATP-dependent DNA helicase Q1
MSSKLTHQIEDVRDQIKPLQILLATLQKDRSQLEKQLASLARRPLPSSSTAASFSSRTVTIDYQTSTFPWSQQLPPLLKRTFNIPSFRLCQEGVVNAAIDGRDIVCVMPTGGGKSLTYQLPAMMGNGLTVVVSPLLALIWDQVRALKEVGIECAVSCFLLVLRLSLRW